MNPVWTVQEEDMSVYTECFWRARWSALLKRPYLLTLWRFRSEQLLQRSTTSKWMDIQKERKSKVWGKVANLQHTWGITLRSTLRGQTAYQKEFLMSDSHSPRSFDPWWGKGALLNTSRPLGCSESGLRAKSGSRNTPRCKPGYRGSGT